MARASKGGLAALLRDSGTLLMGTGAASVASLGTLVLLLSHLGSESVGALIVFATYPLWIQQVLSFQSWQGVIRFGLGEVRAGRLVEFETLVKFYVVVDGVVALVAAGVGFALVPLVIALLDWPEDWLLPLRAFALTLAINLSSVPIAVLRIFDRYRLQATLNALPALAQLLCATALVLGDAELAAFVLAWLAIAVAAALLNLAVALRVLAANGCGGWWSQRFVFRRKWLYFSAWLNVTTALDSVFKQFDTLLVASLVAVEAVPFYRFMKQLAALLQRASDALVQAVYPRFVAYVVNQNVAGARDLFLQMVRITGPVVLLFVAFAGGTSMLWIGPVLGPEFQSLWLDLLVYTMLVGLFVLTAPVHPLMYAMGHVRDAAVITLLGASAFIAVALSLAASLQIMAFVLAYGAFVIITVTGKLLVVWLRAPLAGADQGPVETDSRSEHDHS